MAQHHQQDSSFFLTAHLTSGITLFCLGEIAAARDHLEQARSFYNPAEHGANAFIYGEDHGVVCLTYLTFALWVLGFPDRALKHGEEALALARKLEHPFTLAFALNFTAGLHELRREPRIVLARAEALIALAEEQGFPFWHACGLIQKGSALIEFANIEEGLPLVDQGVEILQAAGAQIGKSGGLAQRAFVYGKLGRVDEGLHLIDEALALVQNGSERQDEAEQHRIKGELLLIQGASVQAANGQGANSNEQLAEACFRQAIEIARRQQAKSWELRAAMSLARLWQKQRKKAEAHSLLTEVYNWFTEGFETADLQEAKALLDELS